MLKFFEQMGCFNDLPSDVKWLIFRTVIVSIIWSSYSNLNVFFEKG